eukprot:2057683-Rhodomonas_salina.1
MEVAECVEGSEREEQVGEQGEQGGEVVAGEERRERGQAKNGGDAREAVAPGKGARREAGARGAGGVREKSHCRERWSQAAGTSIEMKEARAERGAAVAQGKPGEWDSTHQRSRYSSTQRTSGSELRGTAPELANQGSCERSGSHNLAEQCCVPRLDPSQSVVRVAC